MDIVLTNWAEAAYVANEFPTEFRDNSKNWYNDDWLDRIIAAMSFLAGDGKEEISVPLSAKESLAVHRLPMMFESPVSYEIVEEQAVLEDEPHHDGDGEGDEVADDEGGEA